MTHRGETERDDQPGHAQADSTWATSADDEALLDHHIEETLRAFNDLRFLRLPGPAENCV
jgi:hypothetical protein